VDTENVHDACQDFEALGLANETNTCGSRNSIAGIAHRLRAARSEVRSRQGQEIFCSPKLPDRLWGPLCLLFNGYRPSFPGPRRPGLDVVYSSPSRTEVKNKWSYTYSTPIRLHAVDRGNFYCLVKIEVLGPKLYYWKVNDTGQGRNCVTVTE